MHYETIRLKPFAVIGIAVRTTNKAGQSQQDIGRLWDRFFSEAILLQIPNRESDAIYCVYTDYENSAGGAYTALLGCAVATLQAIPEGLAGIEVPGAAYRVYTSTGKLPGCVLATWQHIWQTPVDRSYTADFDVYGVKAQDPANAEVKTFLSVR